MMGSNTRYGGSGVGGSRAGSQLEVKSSYNAKPRDIHSNINIKNMYYKSTKDL